MNAPRKLVDQINDEELAALYERAERAESERDKACTAFNAKTLRLEDAEAAIERVRALHRPVGDGGPAICVECSAYDEQHGSTDNSPVTYDQCGTLAMLDQQPA